jgi:TIGR03009 family protein
MMAWVCGISCGLTVGVIPIAMAQGQASKTKAPSAGKAPAKTGTAPKTGGAKPLEVEDADNGDIGEPGVAPANAGKGKTQRPPAGTQNSARPNSQRPPRDDGDADAIRPDSQKTGQSKPRPQGPASDRPMAGPQGTPDPNAIIPCPFKALTKAQQKELDELLAKWEERSGKIERFRCKFERWEYDPVFGPPNPKDAKTFGLGDLKYAAPDKGLFKVNTMKVWQLPVGKDGKPVPGAEGIYEEKPGVHGEHWVCDGKAVFAWDYPQKVIKKLPLPPDMQGKKIVDGPLPFLFGAKAEVLKKRYWLRVTTPDDVQDQFWIEAWPKYVGDRQNFYNITVILSAKEFLPDAMEVNDPSFRPNTHPNPNEKRTVYSFTKREVNWTVSGLSKLNVFHKEFYEPEAPFGWSIKVEEFAPPDAETVQRPQPPAEKTSPKNKKG